MPEEVDAAVRQTVFAGFVYKKLMDGTLKNVFIRCHRSFVKPCKYPAGRIDTFHSSCNQHYNVT